MSPFWKMKHTTRIAPAATALVLMIGGLQAADRAEITFADGRTFPESLTSTKNGDLYFGSLGLDSVYRAPSKSTQATTWIQPKANGLTTVLRVLADERAGVLWVCASASGGPKGRSDPALLASPVG